MIDQIQSRVQDRIKDRVKDQIAHLQNAAEVWTPQRVLAWAFETFGDGVAISSAFGAEGMVLIDMASRVRKDFRLFTIDTEFLFPETYNLMDRIEEKYGITIEKVYSALSPEEQERTHGDGALDARSRPVLQHAESRTAAPQARRTERVDREHSPRPDLGPFHRAQN